MAPANNPADPVNKIALLDTAAPATPMTKLILETNPSFAPKTAARNAFPPTDLCLLSNFDKNPPETFKAEFEFTASIIFKWLCSKPLTFSPASILFLTLFIANCFSIFDKLLMMEL